MLENPVTAPQAVLPDAIPLNTVVGLDLEGLRTFIEFDAFDDVRAGSICIDNAMHDWRMRPAPVRPRASLDSIVHASTGQDPALYRQRIERDLALLMNEPTLNGLDHVGRLKAQLEFSLACGTVLERERGFMDNPRYELLKGRWTDALAMWRTQHPTGRALRLELATAVLAEATLICYRDRFRAARRSDIAQNIGDKLGLWKFKTAASLWTRERWRIGA